MLRPAAATPPSWPHARGATRLAIRSLLAACLAVAGLGAALGGVCVVAARRLPPGRGLMVLLTWPLAFLLLATGWTTIALAALAAAAAGWLAYHIARRGW